MWSPPTPDWSKNVGPTFLIASWHELFFAYTPDSNQPRLHNVASLIDELADIAARWCKDPVNKGHATKVQKELAVAIEDEADILGLLPEFRSRSKHLASETSPTAVLMGCAILIEKRREYEKALIDIATIAINGLPKKKEAAHTNIRRLATIAFQYGKEDNDVWDPLQKDAAATVNDALVEIIVLSTAGLRNYRCTLAISGSASEIQSNVRKVKGSLVSRSGLPQTYLAEFESLNNLPNFVEFVEEATSIRSAVVSCQKRLNISTGLVSLYQNSPPLQVHPKAYVRVDSSEAIFSQSGQAFRRLHPRARAQDDIHQALDLLNRQGADNRLLAAIDLLSIASTNSDSRIRLINLWSSVETLSGGHEGESTLERVTSLLVPLIISRYVSRAIRYLAIETQQFGKLVGKFNYGIGFPKSSDKYVSPVDMMRTLTSPKNSTAICELLKFVEHPLLRYRIYTAWKRFHNPRLLAGALAKAQDRLEWHIARIYRARNRLIHEGEESPFLVPLLDNLQIYISMAVQRLIHELKRHPTWNVRHAIEYWKGQKTYLLESLNSTPGALTFGDFIDTGSNDKVWPSF